MIGRIISFKDDYFFAFIPPENDLFAMEAEITEDQYAYYKKHSLPIYKLGIVKESVKELWRKKNGQKFRGNILRENFQSYFELEPSLYIQDELLKEARIKEKEQQKIIEETKTVISIKAILGNFKKTALTMAQYEYLQRMGKEENVITCYMANGFCVNNTYIIYGTLSKKEKGKIMFPQLKIKESKKSK